MKLRNLKMNESIEKQYSKALENEHTVLEPTEANALEMEKERKEIIKDDFKEQDKIADEVAKATNATEVSEPRKVKDRKELSKLLAEAKESGKQYKISRCNEEGYRYLFETIEPEETKEILTEAESKCPECGKEPCECEAKETAVKEEISARPNHDKMLDMLSQGVLDYKAVAEECLSQMSDDQVEDVLKAFDLEECNKVLKEETALTEETNMQKIMKTLDMKADEIKEESLTESKDKYCCLDEDGNIIKEFTDIKEAIKFAEANINSVADVYAYVNGEPDSTVWARDLDESLKEELDEESSFDLNSELYQSLMPVIKKFLDKGLTLKDLDGAYEFCTIHMEDDEELPDEFFAEAETEESKVEEKSEVEESIEEDKPYTDESVMEADLVDFFGGKDKISIDNFDKEAFKEFVEENNSDDYLDVSEYADEVEEYLKNRKPESDKINELFDMDAGIDLNVDARGQSVGILGGTGSTDSGGGVLNVQGMGGSDLAALGESKEEELSDETEKLTEDIDEKPFEQEKVEYEIDDEFDWKL